MNTSSKRDNICRLLTIVTFLLLMTHLAAGAFAPAVQLGRPGLSFRYTETFGQTGVPYVTDENHMVGPEGVAVDSVGNLFVAETNGGHRVFKFAQDGTLLMILGEASPEPVDETHLCEASDIAIESAGNFWVADRCAARVVKYDPDGNYLTQIGVTNEIGDDNQHFGFPVGIAIDSAGNIFVSDDDNYRIQKYDKNGVYVATLGQVGQPGAGDDQFLSPYRLAVDADDALYVVDMSNQRVQIFDSGLALIGTLGVTGESGDANDHLNEPRGVAVDATYIYVADSGNNRVQIYNRASREYVATLGSQGYENGQFFWPGDVAVDSTGKLFVPEVYNHRVQMFGADWAYARTFGTSGVPYLVDGAHFNNPMNVAVDASGNIGVVEEWGQRFVKLDPQGQLLFIIGQTGVPGGDNDHLNFPWGVAFDASGKTYISDQNNNRIQIFSSSGAYQATLGTGYGTGQYEFNGPRRVEVDQNGNIYVADTFNNRVQIYNQNFYYVATLGSFTGEPGSDDSHFIEAQDVKVDQNGNIFVVDTLNHRVQKFNSSRQLVMTLGVTGECSDDFAHFCAPSGVTVDKAGDIYVADVQNNRVQVFDPSGAYLTTIGGSDGYQNGQLNRPYGVEVDAQGNVFIADKDAHRIQKFTPGVPGWSQSNNNGFGDRTNIGVSALEVFNGQLYAGSSNWNNGGQVWRMVAGDQWQAVTQPNFGDGENEIYGSGVLDLTVYNGQLYAGSGWGDSLGQIWRTENGSAWQPVTGNGFNNPENIAVTSFASFKSMLYAGVTNANRTAQIWRSESGNYGSWGQVYTGPAGTDNVTGFAVFNGVLYAAVEGEVMQIWRATSGSDWEVMVADGFGNPNNKSAGGFIQYLGSLVIGTSNDVDGAQIWYTDGSTWQMLAGGGMGNPANIKVETMQTHQGLLYMVLMNLNDGMVVLRTADGLVWQPVSPAGFGDSQNVSTLWSNATTAYQNDLYIGTWNYGNGGELWRLDSVRMYLPSVIRTP